MDLTKVRLQTDRRYTFSGIPVYLLIAGSKKLLVTSSLLKEKKPELYAAIHVMPFRSWDIGRWSRSETKAKLTKPGQGLKVGNVRVYRVSPTKLSREQRELLVGLREAKDVRREFIKTGRSRPSYAEGEAVQSEEAVGVVFSEPSPDGRLDIKWYTGAVSRSHIGAITNEVTKTRISREVERPKFRGLGVKEVAAKAELKPAEIRRFLRLKNIGKRGGRYYFTTAEAEKVIKAARRYYAD